MFEQVDSRVDFVHLEHDVLKFWRDTKAFETLREINAGNEPWSFLDGPITANNPMGVHHAWGRAYKDAFQRYFAMTGRDLRYQNGFDCQGLWVEIEVEKALGFQTKTDIENFGLEKFTETCKERVWKYSAIQAEQSKRLGYWMDWDNSYFTMSDENNYTIWSFLKACFERGFIYKSTDVMPWSGRAGTAYSDMEVKEGRRLTTHTSVFVRFPLRGRENEFLLIWTTTPWTLTANTGAAVNGELDYVKLQAKKDGAVYYFAQANLEFQRLEKELKEGFPPLGKWPANVPKLKTIAQIFKEQGGYEILGTIKGSDMIGWAYDGPFDDLPAQQRPGGFAFPIDVLPENEREWPSGADGHRVFDPGKTTKGEAYVVTGEGTGIVHSAPGCGDVDHVWGKQQKLVAIAPLDEEGRFVEGFGKFTGMKATDKQLVAAVIADLKEKGLLVATEEYPHIYPHCWRTGDELVFRLVEEWYISMDWREEIMDTAKKVTWLPPQMNGQERELDWLRTMKDWMISKKRFWGLALPIWECEKCRHFTVIGSREELKEKAIDGWAEFDGHSPHRPYVDAVKIACEKCGAKTSRIPDVGNPWLDAGIVAYSTTKFRDDRAYWDKWVPADFITECFPGQFRNWFYAILAMSTMMEMARVGDTPADRPKRKPPFKNLLGHALVQDENRRAMHKSDGTAIWFEEAAEQLGVDTMRWMYCSQRPTEDLPFGLRHPGTEVTVEGPDGKPITHTVEGVRLCKVTSKPADEVRRRVLITLWNSYSFFANYARLDGFNPATQATLAAAERPDIDRWILSDLQLLIRDVRTGFEKYDMAPVCQRLEKFIDDLSNWYIRRNRRRFWKGADDAATTSPSESAAAPTEGAASGAPSEAGVMDADKLSAYHTLYTVLYTLTKLMAPIIPFATEKMYQNLVRSHDANAPISVHHPPFPVADETLIDDKLSAHMNATIRLVSLGRSLRAAKKIGVRQALAEIVVVPKDAAEKAAAEQFSDQILDELNIKKLTVLDAGSEFLRFEIKPNFAKLGKKLGKAMGAVQKALGAANAAEMAAKVTAGESVTIAADGTDYTLAADELTVQSSVPDGWEAVQDFNTTVALDVRITDDLKREGLAREFIRRVQDLRRSSGLKIDDRITVRVETSDAELAQALAEHRDYIMGELLAVVWHDTLDAAAAAHALDETGKKLAGTVQIDKHRS